MSTAARECRYCRQTFHVRVGTDGSGQLVDDPLPCNCKERRRRGLCIDCSGAVRGKSWRCEPCKAEAQLESCRRWRERHPERARRAWRRHHQREKRQRKTKKHGDAIRARDRAYRRKNRDRINENRRRRNLRDMGAKKAEHRRRYEERHPERVAASQRKTNARPERVRARREWAHLYQTKYVGPGRSPVCRQEDCENEIPWDGKGRPRSDCFVCRPLDSRERKSERIRELAATQEIGASS